MKQFRTSGKGYKRSVGEPSEGQLQRVSAKVSCVKKDRQITEDREKYRLDKDRRCCNDQWDAFMFS